MDQRQKDQGRRAGVESAYSGLECLTSEEVAEWVRVSPSTLCRWRQMGLGPRVTWLSPSCPRYVRADVIGWLEQAAA